MPLNFYKIRRLVHFDDMEWHENELVSNFSKKNEWHVSNRPYILLLIDGQNFLCWFFRVFILHPNFLNKYA
jgi:hypothetical protein